MSKEDLIYLDYASTAPIRGGVLESMLPYLGEQFGNPSSVHQRGRQARHALENARDSVASVLGVLPAEVIFTGGGTESNNLGLRGALGSAGCDRIVTVRSEHHSVLHTATDLLGTGVDIRLVDTTPEGGVSIPDLEHALSGDPAVVSVMHVNNETGCINPIEELSDIVRSAGGLLHCDAIQSVNCFQLSDLLPFVDLLSLSGHKAGGPKGVGILFVRSSTDIAAQMTGGPQERGRRAGTENVAAATGFSHAILASQSAARTEGVRLQRMVESLRSRLEASFGSNIRFTVAARHASPHILHAVVVDDAGNGLDGEMMILGMDLAGVCISSGSACASGTVAPSHVMEAIGLTPEVARGAIRVSVGARTTEDEIDEASVRFERVLKKMLTSA